MASRNGWKRYALASGRGVHLRGFDPEDVSAFEGGKKAAHRASVRLSRRLEELQALLFAERTHAVLVVLQGMDAAGKDGTIRRVFEGVDPQGVRVVGFRRPVGIEAGHDFLWRVHRQVPARGELVLFNRSHYEDVLVVRVHDLVPSRVWRARYEEINDFERMLTREGTTVLKFFLHVSEAEQANRLRARATAAAKRWKSSRADATEASHWEEYARAYEAMLQRTSTTWAPWYVIPSDHKWYRDWLVSTILVARLEALGMRWPRAAPPEIEGATAA